jgi:UDP-glucose 4-epimerase
MKTIGITGASGMIGSKLLPHLSKVFPESRFKCLVRSLPLKATSPMTDWLQGDLMSEPDCVEFVAGLDVLIHLAQANSPALSDRHWPSDMQCNLISSLNLLQALRAHGKPCHLVFASSGGAIYGAGPVDRPPFDEDATCQPVSPYGIQKQAVENYIRLAVLQGGMSATILRISNAYGVSLPWKNGRGFSVWLPVGCDVDYPSKFLALWKPSATMCI